MRIAIAERLSIKMPLPGTNESMIRLFAKTMAVGKAGPKPREYHRDAATQRPTFSNHHRRRCKHYIRGLAQRPPAQQMRAVVADGGGTCGIVDVAKHEISHYLSSNIGKSVAVYQRWADYCRVSPSSARNATVCSLVLNTAVLPRIRSHTLPSSS